MNTRLQQFLDLENLSPARLADIIGVQRSGLSHILSGRNKPSFDFIRRILVKFPRINADWLITGKGKPYKDFEQTPPSSVVSGPAENFLKQSPTGNARLEQDQDSIIDFGDQTSFGWNGDGENFEKNGLYNNSGDFSTESSNYEHGANTLKNTDIESITPKNNAQQPVENCTNDPKSIGYREKRAVKRVIIFYNDGSFEELYPRIR